MALVSRDEYAAETAVSDYNLALLLNPEDPTLHLELGLALALRAKSEHRPLDYESALDQLMESEKRGRAPEAEFDIALLMDEIPLPLQSGKRWQQATKIEPGKAWQQEIQTREAGAEAVLTRRARLIQNLTASPASYLTHAEEGNGSVEVVLDVGVTAWLLDQSDEAREALTRLGRVLGVQYKDAWLTDLLNTPGSFENNTALRELTESVSENFKANHEHALAAAVNAERLFTRTGNTAGALRARIERVYALDRSSKTQDCLKLLTGLRSRAHRRHYVWIEAQARLEDVTCITKTRKTDVIAMREQVLSWVAKTNYQGLYLRALNFQTEKYVSFDSRLTLWRRGREGLLTFWDNALPDMRGYPFYYNLAKSAKDAGHREAAIALLQESALLLNSLPNAQVHGIVLSELGLWQTESGAVKDAATNFEQMANLFQRVPPSERGSLWEEAEVIRAQAETMAGRPQLCVDRLQRLSRGNKEPYSNLDPIVRRRLLPALGDAYLALGRTSEAASTYTLIINESRQNVQSVMVPSQRGNAQAEIESAWRGRTEVSLRGGDATEALTTWEGFRGGRSREPAPLQIRPPEGVVFLAYAFLNGGLSGWMVDHKGVEQRWLDMKSVRQSAAQFAGLAADQESPPNAVSASSRRLYAALIEPFAMKLPSRGTLIVDAEGPLAAIPWGALEDSQGNTIVDRYAVSQTIGWTETSQQVQSNGTESFQDVLIIAEPILGPESTGVFPPLDAARREAQRLNLRLEAKRKHHRFFKNNEATLRALLTYAPQSSLLYFAGHGLSYGGFGALLMAPSGQEKTRPTVVTADAIAQMNLSHLRLVVLAACSSGAGESSGVVSLDSLVRGFLDAGASRVVAARWNVSSTQTAELMDSFFDRLLEHDRPAEALRDAAIKIRGKSSTAHPYFWAGFQVFGAP